MNMFWIGLGVGAVIGGTFGIFIMAICIISKGDNNGDN